MAWARVQGKIFANSGGASATTIALTFTGAVGSGNMVVGALTFDTTNTTTISSISDDKGNSYAVIEQQRDITNGTETAIFWAKNLTNAPSTITATLGATSSFRGMQATEFSGNSSTSAVDGANDNIQTNPGTGTGAVTTGSITTTANGDLVYAVNYVSGGTQPSSISAGSGWAAAEDGTGDANVKNLSEYQTQGSAGAIAGAFTYGSSASNTTASSLIAAFTASGSVSARAPSLALTGCG